MYVKLAILDIFVFVFAFRPSDVGLLAVTANNIITINKVNNRNQEDFSHILLSHA